MSGEINWNQLKRRGLDFIADGTAGTAIYKSTDGESVKVDGGTVNLPDGGQLVITGSIMSRKQLLDRFDDPDCRVKTTTPKRRTLKKVADRRSEVEKLYRQGLTQENVAERLGCGVRTIQRDLKELGLK